MDDYLKSLVKIKKEEEPTEPAVEVTDEVIEPAAEVAEESAEVAEPAAEQPIEAEVVVEPKKEEPKPKKEEPKPKKESSKANDLVVDQVYVAQTIRIYRTPSIQQISFAYSGNVIYKGTIGEFDIIQYMKSGFGLVQGYVKDLKNHLA